MEKDFDPIASVFDSAAALSELADGLESDRQGSAVMLRLIAPQLRRAAERIEHEESSKRPRVGVRALREADPAKYWDNVEVNGNG